MIHLTWYTSYAEFKMKTGAVMYFSTYCGKMHCEAYMCQINSQNVQENQNRSEDAQYLFGITDRTCAVLIQVLFYSLSKVFI